MFTPLSQKMKSFISRISIKQTPQLVVEPAEEVTQNTLLKDMEEWIDEYLTEISKVEVFYQQKILEYKLEFQMLKLSLKTQNNDQKLFKKKGKMFHRQKLITQEANQSPFFESENNLEMGQFKDLELLPALSPMHRHILK